MNVRQIRDWLGVSKVQCSACPATHRGNPGSALVTGWRYHTRWFCPNCWYDLGAEGA